MVWPLTWVVVTGTLPGVLIGAVVRVAYLPNPKHFKLFAAAVLLYIGLRMVQELLKRSTGGNMKADAEKNSRKWCVVIESRCRPGKGRLRCCRQ